MQLLDHSFLSPEENLVYDEVLLDHCEAGFDQDILRFWESPTHFVVVGYSNRKMSDVNETACQKSGIPILRRCSGGGTVLQGPGCLNYSLVLHLKGGFPIQNISETTHFILNRHRRVVQNFLSFPVKIEGISDLAVNEYKFSGNAQRRKRLSILFHGTFLYDFEIYLLDRFLMIPSQQPSYRKNRSHSDFVRNVPISSKSLKRALQYIWQTNEIFDSKR
jgi:lipoate---protein ligase